MSYAPSWAEKSIMVSKIITLMDVDMVGAQWEGVPFTASGHLWEGEAGIPMPGETVHVLYVSDETGIETIVGDVITLADGSWSISVTISGGGGGGMHHIRAGYDGDATHEPVWGNSPMFIVQLPIGTDVTIEAPNNVRLNEEFIISGVLRRLDNYEVIPGETIHLSHNAAGIGYVTTDAVGSYSFVYSISILGTHLLRAEFLGNGTAGLGASTASIGIIAGEVSFFEFIWAYFVELTENLQLPVPEKPPSPPPLPFES